MEASKKPRQPPKTNSSLGIVAQAHVHLWGQPLGTITGYRSGRIGFSYEPGYFTTGVAISPKFLPLEPRTFEFPELRGMEAFMGLLGVLADSLPDTFGNLAIRSYFEALGQPDRALSPVQRLLYVGNRAMGALEYLPHLQRKTFRSCCTSVTGANQCRFGHSSRKVPLQLLLSAEPIVSKQLMPHQILRSC